MRADLRGLAESATFGAALASVAYASFALVRLRRFAREIRERPPATIRPAMTILKPVRGIEPHLEANLRSFCEQDYPEYNVVLGVQHAGDPALEIVRRVAADFPDRTAVVVGDGTARAANPKIANLIPMLAHARGEILAICDADMRVRPDYLEAIAGAFDDPGVGAVTALYHGEPADDGLASVLGAMCFDEQFAPSVLVANALEPLTYTFGSTMAVRRKLFDAIGGFEALGREIADDFALGRLASERSRVALARYVVTNIVVERDIRGLASHELRWSRTIRTVRPASYVGIPLTYPLACAVLHVAVARDRGRAATLLALAALTRFGIHRVAHEVFGSRRPPSPLLVPLRDALSAAIWTAGLFGRDVRWQGRALRIARGGAVEPG
jgi:ceramide glucosyltransferase